MTMRIALLSIPGPEQSRARSILKWQFALCASLSLVVVMACQDASSLGAMAEGATADGLCLVQLRSQHIEVVTLNGGHAAPGIRINEPASLSWGRLSPDGSYVVGTDGSHLVGTTVTGDLLWDLKGVSVSGMPAISTDARKIAFTSSNQELTMYDVTTRELNVFKVNGQNPSWAPDGDRLAYDDGTQVHVYDLGRATAAAIGQGTEPSWTPDGVNLAVRVATQRLDLVNVQTRERRSFLQASSNISVPRWSPNGEWMMYTRRGPRHWWSRAEWTGSEPSQILIRYVKTGTETSISEFYKANPGDYTWVTNRELCRQVSDR